MGLDMYAWRVPADKAVDDFTIDKKDDGYEAMEELFYWRKHHDLHGYMEQLYRRKGGPKVEFNCERLRLTNEDLDDLEATIKARQLPETTGFFFGNNPPDAETDDNDLQFIAKARQVLAEGDAVYYDSWW